MIADLLEPVLMCSNCTMDELIASYLVGGIDKQLFERCENFQKSHSIDVVEKDLSTGTPSADNNGKSCLATPS